MKHFGFRLFLLVIMAVSVNMGAQDNCRGNEPYTPERGSAERKAILDALRKELYTLHEIRVIFVVNYMKVCEGWAWIHTQPRSADGKDQFEDILALIHKVNKNWIIMEIPCAEEENPDCISSAGYYSSLRKRFPEMPAEILPVY